MNAVLVLVAGIALAACAWSWSMRSLDGAARMAIVAVLGVTAAAFNVVVPVWSIEATTTVVLCTALVLGVRTGIAVGLVAMVASSVTGGIGVWTLWQSVAVVVVACMGAALARTASHADWFRQPRLGLLAISAAVAAIAWDVVTTGGFVLTLAPAGTSLGSALLLGLSFTIVHACFCAALTAVGGPPLIHALARARPRLEGGTVVPGRSHQSPVA